MRNIEFKARLDDPKAAQARARALDADLWGDLRQTDTYFAVPKGRLKLRETAGFPSELVRYERDEESVDRVSEYSKATIADVEGLKEALSSTIGVRGVV